MAALALRSLITSEGVLRLTLDDQGPLPTPADDEVLVRVEAAPLNPTDHYQMTGPADFATMRRETVDGRPALIMSVPPAALPWVATRLGQSRAVGSEGAGEVVAAGAAAKHLLGKRVTTNAGGMFAQYRLVKAAQCLELPSGVSAAEGAAAFVNPLTVLGFVETMRSEGFTGLVHAAAASNLGQMLVRLCAAENIPLVNIVRSAAQVALLKGMGAKYVLDSTAPDFMANLVEALAQTGARLGFDPTGGGTMASDMLAAMEQADLRGATGHLVYGTAAPKKVYIYGGLQGGPTLLNRAYGFAWELGGWLMPNFLAKAGPEVSARLRQRVVDNITTIFASSYSRTISLSDIIDPDVFRAFQARATGEKFLVDPTRG